MSPSRLDDLSEEQLFALERKARAALAASLDDPVGFSHFYWLIFGSEIPAHALDWIEKIYNARARGKGIVIQAFRGSTKTTTLTLAFFAWRVGKEPHRANLLIQVGDDIAQDNARAIAEIIERNPGWKEVFPHIVPNLDKWGAAGYDVTRTDLSIGDWSSMCAKRKDPTFVGVGYKSRAIIGKHPDGLLVVDDINDENNTGSDREATNVIQILTGTIIPTVTRDTWQIYVGTPWTTKDAISYIASTGEFDLVKTPVLTEAGQPVWPTKFPAEEVERLRRLSGTIEFARMYLLDLAAASGTILRKDWLHEYPAEKIDPSWPVYFGVDYASTADMKKADEHDYFCVAIGRVLPGGGLVLVDGFRGHVSQGQAEQKLRALAETWRPWLIGIEAVGSGQEFYNLMLRTSSLPLMECKIGNRRKGMRFERQMAPVFESGRAWVSSLASPFLTAFRNEWVAYPNGEHDDTLDAVYWMCHVAQGSLMPDPDREDWGKRRQRRPNPFNVRSVTNESR